MALQEHVTATRIEWGNQISSQNLHYQVDSKIKADLPHRGKSGVEVRAEI